MIRQRLVIALAALVAMPAFAQQPPPSAKETSVLQRVPINGTDREMGLGIAVFPPHAAKSRHAASGPELCYVLEGDVTVQVDGQPTRVVHKGETFQLPAYALHTTTAGPDGARVLASWAHVPGQPFNLPGPR
jgi:quercetin dioxygenase-like cupin family protein